MSDSARGTLLGGRYRLDSVLGRGGMGTVWRAHDDVLDRAVAVKEVLLHPALGDAERRERHERTLREARASARLNHPGVVTVHDVVDFDDRPWIVMELVDARSLQDVLDEDGPLTPARAAGIGRQMLAALRAAHAIGILHRDVKPANVLLARDGRAVLTDFGIAQVAGDATLTRTGLIMGSPAYMSPERVRGERALPASDLWALGATLYAAVEGRPPHHRTDAMAVLAAVMTQPPDPPRRAGPLAGVLFALLDADPVRRPTADAADAALAAVESGEATDAVPPPRAPAAPDATAQDHGIAPAPVSPGQTWSAPVPPPHAPTWSAPVPAPSAPTWSAPARRRSPVLAVTAGVAATAVAAGVLAFVLWPDGKTPGPDPRRTDAAAAADTGRPTGPAADPSTDATAPASDTPTTPTAPPGTRISGGDGYRLPVPAGWTRKDDPPYRRSWTDPATKAYVLVDRTPWEGDPYAHWEQFESEVRANNRLPGYQRTSLNWADGTSPRAADLEYTWLNGRMHAVSRGVAAGARHYAVMIAYPDRAAGRRALLLDCLEGFRA
ncbi:serine/threonine-protein kinase [Actinomadura atramentaria]|uniref:serine/threonine-protein kinase n=1 Tax=Actinomadura atramentaria TaxID=1990 RepID=UPI000382D519|nr:serine/threonine-protein kinase [Actinomadura atramentaria]